MKKYENVEISAFLELLKNDADFLSIPDELIVYNNLTTIFPTFAYSPIYKDNLLIKTNSSKQERCKNTFYISYKISLKIIKEMINDLFDRYSADYQQFEDVFLDILQNFKFTNENIIKHIQHGIKLYEKKDYISSMHILVFQIERILRDILNDIQPSFELKRNKNVTMKNDTLTGIILKLKETDAFENKLLDFIENSLTNQLVSNLRNDIAHGELQFSRYTKSNCELLITILLKIMNYKKA